MSTKSHILREGLRFPNVCWSYSIKTTTKRPAKRGPQGSTRKHCWLRVLGLYLPVVVWFHCPAVISTNMLDRDCTDHSWFLPWHPLPVTPGPTNRATEKSRSTARSLSKRTCITHIPNHILEGGYGSLGVDFLLYRPPDVKAGVQSLVVYIVCSHLSLFFVTM